MEITNFSKTFSVYSSQRLFGFVADRVVLQKETIMNMIHPLMNA